MFQDLKLGLRTMLRAPAFAGTVVLLLGLGIGATTAVFSLVEAVVLAPLPYPSPDRLMMIWEMEEGRRGPYPIPVKPAWLDQWRRQAGSFESVTAALVPWDCRLAGGDEPVRVLGARVTSDLLAMLGAEVSSGRPLLPEDGRPGAPSVVVLSDQLWKRSFGASLEVLGQTVELDGEAYTVIGILAPGFDLLTDWTAGRQVELWTPLSVAGLVATEPDVHSLAVFARLKDGASRAQAQAEMDAITANLRAASPETESDHRVRVDPYREALVGASERQAWMLFAAAAFVLLIVCANAGGLLLARTAGRRGELAIRSSLGASRGRLIRQLLAESLPLGIAGGAAGTVFAAGGLRILRATIPADVPRAQEMALDAGSLAFTAGLVLLATVALALVPALDASGAHLAPRLGRRSGGLSLGRGRGLLIAAQVGLTLVLAHGAALMLLSYGKLQATDQGYDPRVLTARLFPTGPRYEHLEAVVALARELVPRLVALPGVEDAAAIDVLPLGGFPTERVVIEGRKSDWEGTEGPRVWRSFVTPGYFRTMGISLAAGRPLSERDLSSEIPVAVVNKTMARRAWPDENPVGRRFSLDPGSGWITVVGVVADVRQLGSERPAMPQAYYPMSSLAAYWAGWDPYLETLSVALKSKAPTASLVGPFKAAVRSLDPSQPVSELRTMGQILHIEDERRRFNTLLITLFAALGTILVVAGVYALMSTFVTQRRQEIGVRMALGARAAGVVRLVLGQGTWLLLAGLGGGLAAALASTRLLQGLLYGVSATEPAVLVAGAAFVALVALLGSLVPALKAARIDPSTVLRAE